MSEPSRCLSCGEEKRTYRSNGNIMPYGPFYADQMVMRWSGFKEDDIRSQAGLYMAATSSGRILYVGSAKSVHDRVTSHRATPWLRLFGEGVRWFACYFPDTPLEDIRERERRLIREINPPGNCIGATHE